MVHILNNQGIGLFNYADTNPHHPDNPPDEPDEPEIPDYAL
jgi:hypothetical protein